MARVRLECERAPRNFASPFVTKARWGLFVTTDHNIQMFEYYNTGIIRAENSRVKSVGTRMTSACCRAWPYAYRRGRTGGEFRRGRTPNRATRAYLRFTAPDRGSLRRGLRHRIRRAVTADLPSSLSIKRRNVAPRILNKLIDFRIGSSEKHLRDIRDWGGIESTNWSGLAGKSPRP